MKKFLPLYVAALCSPTSFAAEYEVDFTYNSDNQPWRGYGYARTDAYDVCIRVNDPSVIGGQIRSLSVPVPEVEGCSISSDASAWIVTDLNKEPISPDNSIAYVSISTDGKSVEATFPEGIVIPEEGFYVGYSVKVDQIAENCRTFPMAIVDGSTPGSMYFRSTQLTNWDNTSNRMEYMSPMIVSVSKELPEISVSPSLPENFRVIAGSTSTISLTLTNSGIMPVNSVKFSISAPGWNDEQSVALDPSALSAFGMSTILPIEVNVPNKLGNTPLSVNVTEVNGMPNVGNPSTASDVTLRVLPTLPQYRPLVEEYTALSCGNCPMGWVTLEEANDMYGSNFVFLTYHAADAISTPVNMPANPRSVPAMSINRGTLSDVYDLTTDLKDLVGLPSDIDVKVEATWASADRSAINATATVSFMESVDNANYSVILYLVGDKVTNPKWIQTNYFSGLPDRGGKYWPIFTRGGAHITGLDYNGLAILSSDTDGTCVSVPSKIDEFDSFSGSHTFYMSEGRSIQGYDLVNNPDYLRVVALVLDNKTRKPVNVISTGYASGFGLTSIDGISASPEVIATRYYSLEGLPLSAPVKGIPYIEHLTLSDSTIKTAIRINP